MKQEHRFVAELFGYLKPFVATDHPVFISLDGEAAKKGVRSGLFDDADVPDLWFTIVGCANPTLIEAKIIGGNRRMQLGRTQLHRWRTGGGSAHAPHGWVAANEELNQFLYWSHDNFLPKMDASQSTTRYSSIGIPNDAIVFPSIPELALHVLKCHCGIDRHSQNAG
jgi:hypothetical protein